MSTNPVVNWVPNIQPASRPGAVSPKVGPRSCENCPSFLSGAPQTRLIGSSIGGPVCGSKMLPLIMPMQGQDVAKKVVSHIAKACDQYGQEVDLKPLDATAAPELRVGLDPSAMDQDIDSEQNGSCTGCSFYVPANMVRNATGWTGSICRRNGWLMADSRLANYSSKCKTYRAQAGPYPPYRLSTFTFLPQYSKTFGEVNYASRYESSLNDFVDPRDYPTDRPVSDKARLTRGIKAWRKIEDPQGYGEPVYLPIFDQNSTVISKDGKTRKPLFEPDQLALIPRTGDREAPEQYADHSGLTYTFAVLWMKLDETPAAWGMGGTGKTELSRHLAWLMGLPLNVIAIDGSSEVDSIAGKILFKDGQTVPHHGILPKGWASPNVLLLDEPNTGPVEVWQLVRPLTDNRQVLNLAHLEDERIERHADCYFAMAMNPQWHPLNVGAQLIGDADISRLSHVYFSYPPRELEISILQRRVARDGWQVPEDQMIKMMNVAVELRKLSDDGVLHTSWGLRHQIKLARFIRWFDPITAYRRAIGDALEPQQWEAMVSVVRDQF